MTAKLRGISGKQCVRILCNKFGFIIVRQRGSHVVLRKETPNGRVGTVVPMHDDIKRGTLKSILKLAQVAEEDFEKF